jgi:ribose/xylose/arabinose/galactoside ABC-type transport system permease subunit
MSLTEVAATAVPKAPAAEGDERIAHRGPMRRWLISPEIGALIGAVVVWAFLWGNGQTFGTAGTTLNWLDVAAPYGVMATAIALLMIGGEFDLSSGIMTGGSAMMIGLISRFFMGQGVHIGWAILVAFAGAGAIGWFNGYMVNKTGLPSFIITLASFFVARGLMLVLSKRLAQKVYVDQIKDQRGAKGFRQWVAHEWLLKEFTLRDKLFVIAVIVGVALFIYGLCEQSFIRRDSLNISGLGVGAVGIAVALFGFLSMQGTDGMSKNVMFGALAAVGTILTIVGVSGGRWKSRDRAAAEPTSALSKEILMRASLGALGIILACIIHFPFDRSERRAVLTWVSPSVRPIIAVLAGVIGLGLTARSMLPSLRERIRAASVLKLVFFGLYGALVLGALTISGLQLTTVQALRAIGMLLLGTGGIALLLLARGQAAKAHNRSMQLLLGVMAAAALVLMGLVTRVDSTASRFRTQLTAAMIVAATLLLANTLLEFLMEKRAYGSPAADRTGRRIQIIGTLLAALGVIVRLIYTNFTDAHAAALRAAGKPVPTNVLRETVMWWLIVAAVGAYVLAKTRWGNWIFAVGGNKDAARAIGVPANRVKIGLFVVVGLCAALSGTLVALRYGTVQADQGTGLEFEFIIAAVVGGCLMTGGYGSVIGASLGAAILAMSTTGFQTVKGWNSDARYAFLGGVLLVAVLVNNFIRKKAQEAR